MRLLLLLLVIALAAGVQQHHHHHKKQHSHHRGDALIEVGHKAQTHHHAYKVEPCYPPPCPGYDYELEGGSGTTPAGGTAGAQGNGGTNGGGANGGTNGGGTDGGKDGTGGNGGNNGGNDGGGNGNSGTGTNGEGAPTPLAPENPDNSVPTATAPAGSSGGASAAAAGASGAVVSSSSGPGVWIQVVYPPPDPKAGKSDLEAAGCCNPSLAADRAKMLAAQKKIDALTELRAGHIKWLQDAQDAIAKVLRQIAATNETVFELTQDIQLQEQQIEQIQKKIRADILKQNLEAAQEELDKIKENQSSIEAQKSKVQAKADALIEKQHEIMAELKKVPHQNIELVAAKYDPNQQ